MKLPRARIAALALVAIMVGGLAYLRIVPDPGTLAVPAGAKVGDLHLRGCDFMTEGGNREADCGTLVVPENRANPKSRLIALPVIRVRANSEHPAPPIFHLDGGPGQTNLRFPAASRFSDERDVVLVGYRGADGSSVLDCPEVEAALKHSADMLGEKSFEASATAFRACATRFTDEGVDLAGYSAPQLADDLEAARVALGYDRIDLLSESAGTRIAMIYSWRYPQRIHRSVMIGVNPPGHFLWDPQITDEQLRHYAELCAADEGCRKRTDDLAATVRRTASQPPDRWLFLPIKNGDVRVASFFGLFDSTSAAAIPAPMTLDTWLTAADGDPSGLWFMSIAANLVFPTSFVWGQWAAMGMSDAQPAREAFVSGAPGRDPNLGSAATAFAWAGGRLADVWPAAPDAGEYSQVRTSEVETLLVGGTLDFSTPPQVATGEVLPSLPNGHQVVLAELGHTTDFWAVQPEAGSRLITTFLDSGKVDDSLYQYADVDFTPEVSATALAKGILGTMVGVALLAVLSLLWMARQVRKRDGFGRWASAALRTLYTFILGLGGWFLGALIALTALPTVPLDDELLTALSVGLPIGLGVYLAWVNRGWFSNVKAIGFATATGGSVVGGWLGYHTTGGLGALITTIIGATVGANLLLLVLDIARDQSRRNRAAALA